MIASRYHYWLADGAAQDLGPEVAALLPRLHAQARQVLGNASDADDAVQETLVHLLEHRQTLPRDIPLAGVLHRVCGQCAVMVARRRRRQQRRQVPLDEVCVAAATEAPVAVDHLAALNCLSGRDRQIVLGLAEGVSTAALAQRHGLTPGALLVAIHRARRRLAAVLS